MSNISCLKKFYRKTNFQKILTKTIVFDKINNVLEQTFKKTIGFILNKQFFQQIFEKTIVFLTQKTILLNELFYKQFY